MQIQWYPGHMAKARRMLEENLKLIDVVEELVDARAPLATRNPDFDALFSHKSRVILLNKSDLASAEQTKKWIEYYKAQNINAIAFVSTSSAKRKAAVSLIEAAAADKVAKMKEKGVTKTVRAMVVGIPNVGKSTFINRIAGETKAKVGDTPGLLWPKLENEALAKHLAYIGSINDDIMDAERLAADLLGELIAICPNELKERYKKIEEGMAPHELLEAVARSRGFILQGGVMDTERAARIVLDEFRAGRIAKITLESPDKEY